jgi:hypothetical protein
MFLCCARMFGLPIRIVRLGNSLCLVLEHVDNFGIYCLDSSFDDLPGRSSCEY